MQIMNQVIHMEVIIKKIEYDCEKAYLIILNNINHVIDNHSNRMHSHY